MVSGLASAAGHSAAQSAFGCCGLSGCLTMYWMAYVLSGLAAAACLAAASISLRVVLRAMTLRRWIRVMWVSFEVCRATRGGPAFFPLWWATWLRGALV